MSTRIEGADKNGNYTLKLVSGAHCYRIGKRVISITVGEPGKPGTFVRTYLPLHKTYKNKFELVPFDSDQLEGAIVVDIPKPVAPVQQKLKMEFRDDDGNLVLPNMSTGEETTDEVRKAMEPKAKGKKAKVVEPEDEAPVEEATAAHPWKLTKSGDEFRIRDTVTNDLIEAGEDKAELQAKVAEHNAGLEA